jgi:hypothetical protein
MILGEFPQFPQFTLGNAEKCVFSQLSLLFAAKVLWQSHDTRGQSQKVPKHRVHRP